MPVVRQEGAFWVGEFYLEPRTQLGQLVGVKWNDVKKMKERIVGWVNAEKMLLVNSAPETVEDVHYCRELERGDAFIKYEGRNLQSYDYMMDSQGVVHGYARFWLLWKNLSRQDKYWAERNAFQYAIQVTAEREEDAKALVMALREREDYLWRRGIAHITKKGDTRGRHNRKNNAWVETGCGHGHPQGPKDYAIGPNEVDRTDIVNNSVEKGSQVAQPKSRPPAPNSPPPNGFTPIPEYIPEYIKDQLPESKTVQNWASVEVDDETEEKVSGSKRRGSIPDASELPEMPGSNGYGGPGDKTGISRDISADDGFTGTPGYDTGFDAKKAKGVSFKEFVPRIQAKEFVSQLSPSTSVPTVSTTCSVGCRQAGAQVAFSPVPVSYYAQPQSLYIPSGQYGCVADYGQPLTQQDMFHSQGNSYRASQAIY